MYCKFYCFCSSGCICNKHHERHLWWIPALYKTPLLLLLVQVVNCRSRFASVLRVAFEDATLTQCDFYRILKRDAIHARLALVRRLLFSNLQHTQLLRSVQNFKQIQIVASLLRIHIDLDPCSHVASPNVYQ